MLASHNINQIYLIVQHARKLIEFKNNKIVVNKLGL